MKFHHHHCGVLLLLFTAELVSTVLGDDICRATCTMSGGGNEECVFHSNVNLYAGELGYYAFEECGVEVNPTLGIELGKTYHFIQVKINVAHHVLFFYHLFFSHLYRSNCVICARLTDPTIITLLDSLIILMVLTMTLTSLSQALPLPGRVAPAQIV